MNEFELLRDSKNNLLKDRPKEFIPEFVPPHGKVWRSREPMWPQIFNCEVKD